MPQTDDINTRAWKLLQPYISEDGSIPASRIPVLVIDIACSYIGAINDHIGVLNRYKDPLLERIKDLERQLAECREPLMDAEYGPKRKEERMK